MRSKSKLKPKQNKYFIYVCIFSAFIYLYIYSYIFLFIYIYILYMYVFIFIYVSIYIYLYIFLYIYTYTYIIIFIFIYLFLFIHLFIYRKKPRRTVGQSRRVPSLVERDDTRPGLSTGDWWLRPSNQRPCFTAKLLTPNSSTLVSTSLVSACFASTGKHWLFTDRPTVVLCVDVTADCQDTGHPIIFIY